MGRLNILLVIPRYETYGGKGRYVMLMGILYVSSHLKQSGAANVHTLNMNHHAGSEDELLRSRIESLRIDAVGLGGLSGEFADIDRMVRLIKRIDEKIITIVGGGLVTADPQTAMRAMPQADYGVIGEGEITLAELLGALAEGRPVSQIAGIVFRHGAGFVVTPPRPEIADLDRLPFPDYEGFDYGTYLETNPDDSDAGKTYSQVSVIGGRIPAGKCETAVGTGCGRTLRGIHGRCRSVESLPQFQHERQGILRGVSGVYPVVFRRRCAVEPATRIRVRLLEVR